MIESPSDCLVDLFGAAAAHLRHDVAATGALLAGVLERGALAQFPFAAVMASGEYLRDTAEERDIAPDWLLDVLCSARVAMLVPGHVDPESVLLRGVRAYLAGSTEWWDEQDLSVLGFDPMGTLQACVRVLAAAMAWRAADLGMDARDLAAQVCMGLAERRCGLAV